MKNSTTRILSLAVVLLLLTNIGLVLFMVYGKKDHRGRKMRGEPMEMMAKELNMTEQQKKDYKQLKDEHFKSVRPLFDSIRATKTAFFELVKDTSASDSLVDAYSQKVAAQQSKLDKLTFEHFRRVRGLFTAEQQPKFDSFVRKMMQRGGRRDSSGKKNKS
jgi:periplasmic protein CpxP/Spy